MLNGTFDKFIYNFNSNKNNYFTFEKETISFKMNKPVKQNISLGGLDSHIFWTKKALERDGFKVELVNTLPVHIEVFRENNEIKWRLINNTMEIICNSIYELIKIL
jgi:iron complex transport system ATP-binding protein